MIQRDDASSHSSFVTCVENTPGIDFAALSAEMFASYARAATIIVTSSCAASTLGRRTFPFSSASG